MSESNLDPSLPDRPADHRLSPVRFPIALLVGVVILSGLLWILARVIWLPAYFGVFFFLVAGMLAGAASFRVARPLRPMRRGRVAAGVAAVTVVSSGIGLVWEYQYRAATIGELPRFASAYQDAQQRGLSAATVATQARQAFDELLRAQYTPGATIGYVRWAVAAGTARLTLPGGFSEEVSIGHRGWAWLLRTLAAYGLLAVGLWYQLEALRQATPTNNILPPGAEVLEE